MSGFCWFSFFLLVLGSLTRAKSRALVKFRF
ncbi:hypothetical protein X474_25655 [Dethiosulfatarculus sandiegensis]|uniref:Uncharacterized protein n=1 Tax=Dethiosulfatarculus sandiegensis TaxID=1429043 RepID=A0A0D2G8F7_9BACT|nr:hypothetical protein X474_25655 [Dethiosulfatarculus sandiegensis]